MRTVNRVTRQLVPLAYAAEHGVKAEPWHHGLGVVIVDETWREQRLGEWILAYRLGFQEGALIVTELRVFPAEASADRLPGVWSGTIRGDAAGVPAGGIRGRLLRKIRVLEALRSARQPLQEMGR